MKISTDTVYLRQYLGEEGAVRAIAEAGFDCIDFSMDHMIEDDCPLNADNYRELAKHLRTVADGLGIRFNQGHAPFAFRWKEEGIYALAVERTIRSMEIASILGIDTLVVHPLHHKPNITCMDEIWNDNLAFYRELLPYAHEYGVRIAIENMFHVDKRGVATYGVCSDPQRFANAVDALHDPHIVACADVGHVHLLGEKPEELIRVLGHDRLHALHVHDNCTVLDDHTLPYFGNMDWEGVCRALAEIDYDGVFTFEASPFYKHFPADFLPTAVHWVCDMGRYLTAKIDSYREECENG